MQPHSVVIFDIDGVVRDVSGSYRRAIADTVEHFTAEAYRPTQDDIDRLKTEGCWNNDWEASQELIYRFFEGQDRPRLAVSLDFEALVAFFQARYRGENFSGYIQQEPLLLDPAYFANLTETGVLWGFFSGATRLSATYVLEQRLALVQPILTAMEDAPGKPNPLGLFQTLQKIEHRYGIQAERSLGKASLTPADSRLPILYVGDTVADMHTIQKARDSYPNYDWVAVGVIPPHVVDSVAYERNLTKSGAQYVLAKTGLLTPDWIRRTVSL
jgi:HAD superfamily phosphatase